MALSRMVARALQAAVLASMATIGCGGSETSPAIDNDGADAASDAALEAAPDTKDDAPLEAAPDTKDDAPSADANESGPCEPHTCPMLGIDCGNAPDGCEGTLACGACPDGQTCGAAGPNRCGIGECAPKSCVQLGAMCGQVSDGCGAVIPCGHCQEPDSCGGSGQPNVCGCTCDLPHATTACFAGACSIVSCESGWGDCDSSSANGCETDLSSELSCGTCNNPCQPPNAIPVCVEGACEVQTCNAGWKNCDEQYQNGCETNTTISAAHCGDCFNACPTVQNAVASCQVGACIQTCITGFADCDSAPGCEAQLANDSNNCGLCGTSCAVTNGVGGCSNNTCFIASCTAPFGDCNANIADGCETDMTASGGFCPPTLVVSDEIGISSLALSGTQIVFTIYKKFSPGGFVKKVAKTGGAVTELRSGTYSATGIIADATKAYWIEAETFGYGGWVALNGLSSGYFAGTGTSRPAAVAFDDTYIYWTRANAELWRMPKSSSTAELLIAAPAGNGALMADSGTTGQLFFRTATGISGANKNGMAMTELFAELPTTLALDATHLYWLTPTGVRTGSRSGGAAADLTTEAASSNLASDATHLYWTTADGTVRTINKDGTGLRTLTAGQSTPNSVAVDSTHVYWSHSATGTIMRIAK